MAIKLNKNLEGSSSVKMTNIVRLDKPTKLFPKGYEFPIGKLVKVESVPYETEVMGVTQSSKRLTFTYREVGKDKKGSLVVSEFAPKEDDKFEKNLDYLNRRIMHVFENTIGKGKMAEDIEAETFDEYFDKVAEEFNKHVYIENDKNRKEFARFPLYMKILYGTGNNSNRQQLPLFPNYIERAFNEKGEPIPCSLDINPSRDIISSVAAPVAGAMPGGLGTSAMIGGAGLGSEDDFPEDL